VNDIFDANGNVVDPSTYTGDTFDLYGNPVSTMAQTNAVNAAAANSYAATYVAATDPATGTSGTPAWLNSIITAAPSLAQSAASIYASATAKPAAKPALGVVAPSVTAKAAGGMSMTKILFLVGAGILALVLIVPGLMRRGK